MLAQSACLLNMRVVIPSWLPCVDNDATMGSPKLELSSATVEADEFLAAGEAANGQHRIPATEEADEEKSEVQHGIRATRIQEDS